MITALTDRRMPGKKNYYQKVGWVVGKSQKKTGGPSSEHRAANTLETRTKQLRLLKTESAIEEPISQRGKPGGRKGTKTRIISWVTYCARHGSKLRGFRPENNTSGIWPLFKEWHPSCSSEGGVGILGTALLIFRGKDGSPHLQADRVQRVARRVQTAQTRVRLRRRFEI